MDFFDLSDEIGADDWLIPNKEISQRRLIKQTPRHNVYKADWFGDVLVYEPIGADDRKQHLASRRQQNHRQQKINQDELNHRLSLLDLNNNLKSPSIGSVFSFSSSTFSADSEQTDSAYSSISSTPQYHTKNIKSEFEFPTSRLCDSLSSRLDENDNIISHEETSSDSLESEKPATEKQPAAANDNKSKPVILNKESFKFSGSCQQDEGSDTCPELKNSWFELNELRLVAHEGFMLFMGASMDGHLETLGESTSLVMQMNHPKAVSLYHLLHGLNLSYSPTIDRLFTYTHQRKQLDDGAKLNICKQVMNAMTYLHDKNIVHGRLTSVNIYIELNQRVKISLIDDDERPLASPTSGNANCVEFNLPSLTYLSPELIKTISVTDTPTKGCDNNNNNNSLANVHFDTNHLTKSSDIFSFGSLLFELYEERFPFAPVEEPAPTAKTIHKKLMSILDSPAPMSPTSTSTPNPWNGNIKASANELIYQIGSGQIECKNLRNLDNKLRCPALVKRIIEKCWSQDPLMRPHFKQLTNLL